jgi:hypothetical protein
MHKAELLGKIFYPVLNVNKNPCRIVNLNQERAPIYLILALNLLFFSNGLKINIQMAVSKKRKLKTN